MAGCFVKELKSLKKVNGNYYRPVVWEQMISRIGYYNLSTYSDGPMRQMGQKGLFTVMACFYFEEEVTSLFPYINAVAERAELHERPAMVRFVYEGVYCVVYPDRCIASPMDSREHVRSFVDALVGYLSSILHRIHEIKPKYTVFRPGAVPQILRLLPKNNCGDCGLKTCMAFAAMLAKQQALPSQCPHMSRPLTQTYPILDENGCQVSQVTLHLDSGEPKEDRPKGPGESDPGPEPVQELVPPDPGLLGRDLPDPLTPREIQVLGLMGEGQTNPEISQLLEISPHTVKSHVIHIFNKLGVNHRTQAVVWAARQGII